MGIRAWLWRLIAPTSESMCAGFFDIAIRNDPRVSSKRALLRAAIARRVAWRREHTYHEWHTRMSSPEYMEIHRCVIEQLSGLDGIYIAYRKRIRGSTQ